MVSLVFLLELCLMPSFIHASLPFLINPGCDLPECQLPNHPAVFYAEHYVGDNSIHVFYSSLDELTISVIETKKGHGPNVNYTALFGGNYSGAITFGDTTPANSMSLIVRRLIQFDDKGDTGILNVNDTSARSYSLSKLRPNITAGSTNTTQPTFQLPLEEVSLITSGEKVPV